MTGVSVVIPTLGRRDRLQRAIESVEAQTERPESIVVVDGSDDRTVESLVADLDVPFDTTYVHQTGDGGLSGARNLGIEVGDSDLVAFLDDDDQWFPEKLERQVAAYERTGRGLIFCGIKNVRPDGSVTNVRRAESVPDDRSILTGNSIGSPSAVLARRSDVEAVDGFDEGLPTQEDWDFYIRMLQRTEAAAVPDPLVLKEYNPEGMSRNVEHSERDLFRVYRKHREKYDAETERDFMGNYHFTLGRRYAKSGDLNRGRAQLLRSLRHRPKPKTLLYLAVTCLGETGYDFVRRWYAGRS
ncbi:glycosyltransferase family 2 protein [Halomicrobium salinisoli]|uniref:glycosyltransferase family 2 protein n=1 Tax=Halomicrobium salinisoli TaxID=2878391 RepID=UPI001CEFC5FB|nr:glycosyltransferase family 2 protein [Halomicrobium salinisoli]